MFSFPGPVLSPFEWACPEHLGLSSNRLRTGVGCFYSSMYKWSLAPSPNCKCGATDQTADHVISTCPIHRAPRGVAGPTVLNDDAGSIPPQPASDPIGFSPPYEKEEKEVIAGMKQQNKASLFTVDAAIENVLLSASKIKAVREPIVVQKQILA